jgi:putative hemolysin
VRSLSTELFILVLLALANGILAMAETAVVSARRAKLRSQAKKGQEGAIRALELVEHPARFLALVEFWLTGSALAAGVLAGTSLAARVAPRLALWSLLAPIAAPLALFLVALVLTVFLVIFGELLPKRIGLAHPEKVVFLLAGPLRAATVLAAPLLRGLELATNGLTSLLQLRSRPVAESVGDDEVRALVEQGLHAGVFQRAEKEMVEGVLALDKLRVTALMTPRPRIVFLNLDDPEEANWRKIVTSGHSYFPVYQTNRDRIVGLVAVKALWAHSAIGLPATLKNLLVPPLFVPETMMANQLLEKFKQEGKHIAVVTDEFGVVQGLVTLIDVFEAIVGDLPEAGRRGQPEARKREDGSFLIDAALPTGDLKSLLGLDAALPHERAAEFQTVGGFVVTQFGRIPAVGDGFDWAGWRFEVAAMDRHRVDKMLVTRSLQAPATDTPAP